MPISNGVGDRSQEQVELFRNFSRMTMSNVTFPEDVLDEHNSCVFPNETAHQIRDILDKFDGESSLKRVFWEMLSYDRVRDPLPLSLLPPSALPFMSSLEVFATAEACTVVLAVVKYIPAGANLEQVVWAIKRNITNCVVLLTDTSRWTIIYPDESLKPRVRILPLPGPAHERATVARALAAMNAADEEAYEERTSFELAEDLHEAFPGPTPNIGDLLTDFERIAQHPDEEMRALWPFIYSAGQFPLLTPEQERGEDLRGNEAAPDGNGLSYQEWRLVVHNLRLVVWMARKVVRIGIDLTDLVQEGCTGLMIAARRFDPELGYRFTTYAFHWVKQAMYRALHNQCNVIRWPVHRAIDLIPAALEGRENGLKPGEKRVASLPWAVSRRSNNLSFHESDPITSLIKVQAASGVRACLMRLEPRERHVIERRFGIGTGVEETLEAISQDLKLTRERIRQIEAKAMAKLKGFLSFDLHPHCHALRWRHFCSMDDAAAHPEAPFRDFSRGLYNSNPED